MHDLQLSPEDAGRLHQLIHEDAMRRETPLFYGSGDKLHDKLSDIVFNRVQS